MTPFLKRTSIVMNDDSTPLLAVIPIMQVSGADGLDKKLKSGLLKEKYEPRAPEHEISEAVKVIAL